MLKQNGFKDKEIFFEREFLGSRPDIFAEKDDKSILVECCSCRVNKIINYLLDADEVWIITRGIPPWEPIHYIKDKMQWFIFKKGISWREVLEFKKSQVEQIKKVKSPLDRL